VGNIHDQLKFSIDVQNSLRQIIFPQQEIDDYVVVSDQLKGDVDNLIDFSKVDLMNALITKT